MFLLEDILLADFFFDLLKGFKEELLDFTPLVENNLGERPDISQLLILNSEVFAGIYDLFSLVLNDGLVLVPHHLLLFLEVGDGLRQTLLQDLNFVLACLDPVRLQVGSFRVLVLRALVDRDLTLNPPVFVLLFLNLSLLLLKLVTLCDCIQCKFLVLIVNLSLNCLDSYRKETTSKLVRESKHQTRKKPCRQSTRQGALEQNHKRLTSLGFLASLLLELLELLLVLGLNLELHPC